LRVLVIGLADEPSTVGRNLWNNLREQQRAYVASDPLARFVTAEGLELQDDEVHLTRAGYAALAQRVTEILR
jgi:lysophospholipase L1-like esterase